MRSKLRIAHQAFRCARERVASALLLLEKHWGVHNKPTGAKCLEGPGRVQGSREVLGGPKKVPEQPGSSRTEEQFFCL